MKIRNFDVGLESITRWEVSDEVHLPKEGPLAPAFLPQYRPLDEILRRPSLDERLPRLLQPRQLDPDLLEPAEMTAVRLSAQAVLEQAARGKTGQRRRILEAAAATLDDDTALDDEVRSALAALLRA